MTRLTAGREVLEVVASLLQIRRLEALVDFVLEEASVLFERDEKIAGHFDGLATFEEVSLYLLKFLLGLLALQPRSFLLLLECILLLLHFLLSPRQLIHRLILL